ncbi:DUF1330 domain-containing protein [Streptomyces sp. ISL-98]|nr:DUF1330 domain-containing protein [Streptomyces sp. ISL-98]
MTAYVIAEAQHPDTPEVCRYRESAQASIAHYGGRYFIREALPEALEGDWADSNRMVVIEFPSLEQAKGRYTSPEYAQARATRSNINGRRMMFVEGRAGRAYAAWRGHLPGKTRRRTASSAA